MTAAARAAWVAVVGVVCLVVPAGPGGPGGMIGSSRRAFADDKSPSPDDTTTTEDDTKPPSTPADKLFQEAKALRKANKNEEACAKFHEAFTLNPHAIGFLLNVAVCEQKQGAIATALEHFTEARDRAREARLDAQAKVADDHINQISADVPHLTITLAEVTPDTKLVVDDRAVLITQASNLPVDPGNHTITITAPGRVPFQTTISIEKAARNTVTVPALAQPVKNWRKLTGLTTGIAGLVAVVGGIGLSLYAKQKYDREFDGDKPNCSADGCNPEGLTNTQDARSQGTNATVITIVGGLVAVGGAILYFTAPKKSATTTETNSVSFVPTLSPSGIGVSASGAF